MKQQPNSWWHLVGRPEVRKALWILGFGGVIGSILVLTFLAAGAADKTVWD
jgi:hypothetical protein